ncbi:MAG TPA: cell division ATP-binding protein FtsE [Pseudolysinimonas sp.]|nr:cell division ATP-binding protein FtsE [Pseudolysinimonas sp.]
MIRFDQVTKTYAGTTRPALNSVSLEVLKGEFVFLVGASGSGKSSFLRLVLKEERPSKGKIHVLGHELNTLASRKVPYFRRNLGVVFQDFRLLPNKTVFDNVAFALQVIGKSKGFIQEAVPDVLKMVGLAGKQGRFPHELSGGEQQRVAMARAVVNKPAILLADEPTGNLDPSTSAGIMTLLSAINANGTTVIMATHDVGIVNQMQRRVIELVSGQVVRDERGGGYQTQAVPVMRQAQARAMNPDSAIEDAAAAAQPAPATPQAAPAATPAPVPVPAADAPVTGTITEVEPEVVRPATAPPPAQRPAPHVVPRTEEQAPASEPAPLVPPPLVPPKLNEPRRR